MGFGSTGFFFFFFISRTALNGAVQASGVIPGPLQTLGIDALACRFCYNSRTALHGAVQASGVIPGSFQTLGIDALACSS